VSWGGRNWVYSNFSSNQIDIWRTVNVHVYPGFHVGPSLFCVFYARLIIVYSRSRFIHTDDEITSEGLSPSYIALSFDGFGSISWHSICFSALLQFSQFFSLDFQLFWPEYYWRDLIGRNVHLVHQTWCCISLALVYLPFYDHKVFHQVQRWSDKASVLARCNTAHDICRCNLTNMY
jgi:hypothetical protein